VNTVTALARADVLERVRRYGFLVLTGLVLWLGYGAYQGSVQVRLNDFVGRWNSAWAGGMMAMIANTFLSLCGFWFVRNAVDRDERTGVGPILATTPLTRAAYVVGKALSHFTVLALMALLLFASAVAIQLLRGGLGPVAPLDYVAPYAFVVLPALALTAACAIAFETTPGLRGAFGNLAWMFLWTGAIVASVQSSGPFADPFGMRAIEHSMGDAIRAQFPAAHYVGGLSITLGGGPGGPPRPFDYPGMRWDGLFLVSRLFWLLVALGIALLAAIPFHRFDPARARLRGTRATHDPGAARARVRGTRATHDPGAARGFRLPALPTLPPLPGIVGAELRLAFAGANTWWTLVLLGLWVAALLAPLPVARSGILAALWIWGVPRWSSLGARDARDATEGFVLPTPGAAWRQPLAAWAAGVIAAALIGAPVAVRLAAAGSGPGLAAWAAGTLFIPALALACGAWSNTNKLFEALYVVLWYMGPLNRVPGLDYMGATLGAPIAPPSAGAAPPLPGVAHPGLWLALAGGCLVAAIVARVRRLTA